MTQLREEFKIFRKTFHKQLIKSNSVKVFSSAHNLVN